MRQFNYLWVGSCSSNILTVLNCYYYCVKFILVEIRMTAKQDYFNVLNVFRETKLLVKTVCLDSL